MKTFILKIWRGSPGYQYWESFELPLKPHMNVISALMEVQMNPVNLQNERVPPVVWEDGCLEEVCGSCSMLINGTPRQACSALIEKLLDVTKTNIVTLAPFSKFPLVRDLIVDRSSMFDNLQKVHAWIDVDSTSSQGPGPEISPETQELMYALSTCMTCGCCLEACPQINDRSAFVGPQVVAQVRLFNTHPVGVQKKAKRLQALMGKDGINSCGNAQNCVKVCPKKIPLTDSLATLFRDVTLEAFRQAFKNLFRKPS